MARTVLANAAFNSADVSNTTSSDSPPSNPQPGDIWYDTNDGGTFIYYDDGDSTQWVQIIGQAGADAVLGDYSINELNDVDTASSGHTPSDGQALVWDSGMSHWMPGNSGVTVYSTAADLPLSGVTEGSLALVDSTDRLYIWSDLGWYNIALVNTTPTFTTSPNSSYELETNGTATVITVVAEDPEGVPITYATTTSGLTNQATITQGTGANTNVFTITPSTNSANAGTFTVTFTATDGVNTATTGASTFTLTFGDDEFASVALLINGNVTTSTNNSSFGTDSSANGHAVVTTGTPAAGLFGPYGDNWSNYFASGQNVLKVTDSADFDLGTTWTVEAWIFPSAANGSKIFSTRNGSGNMWELLIYASDKKFAFEGYGANNTSGPQKSSSTFEPGQWYHVAVVTSSGATKLYVDGVLEVNYSNSLTWSTAYGPWIGGSSAFSEYAFDGYVSNLRVVKGTAVYTSAFTPPTAPLTAITNTVLLTCQSNRFVDNSASGHTLTLTGTPKVTAWSPFKTGATKTFANTGGSIYLDGSSVSYADIGDAGDFTFGTADFTIDCWVYITDPTQTFNVFNVGPAATGSLGFYWLRNSHPTYPQKFSIVRYGDSPGTFSAAVAPYQWVHVRGVRASGTAKIFINGIESGSASMGSITANSQAEIGNRVWETTGSNASGYGYIADLRVEVGTATSTASFTPPTSQVTTTANTDLLLNFDNAAIYDFSGNNNLKTVGDAGLSFVTKYGTGSLEFDGTGDYLTIPSTQDVALGSGDFTIECWANFSVVGGGNGQGLFQLSNGYLNSQDGRGPAIGINNQNGQWYIYYGAGTNLNTSLGSSPSANTWYHVAFVRTSGVIKIFIDGTQIGSDISYSGNYTDTYLTIGGWYSTNYLLNGYIDDLRITKGVARYTSSFTPPSAIDLSSDTYAENVVLHLDGNGTDGAANNTFTDSSTNNFTVTETGSVVQGVFSPYGDNWSNSFDGNSDYISIADSTDFDFGTGDFTMEAWVFPAALDGSFNENTIISVHEGTDADAYAFSIWSDGRVSLYGAGNNRYYSTSTVSLNEWSHVMVSRYSGTVRFFVNGALDVSTHTATGNFNCTSSGLGIGRQPAGSFQGSPVTRYWNGWLSNVRMVKGTALQTSSFTPSTSPLTNVTNTVLLACQSNRFIDNSSSSHTLTPAGTASVTRFSPFESNKPYNITTYGGSGDFNGSEYLTVATDSNLSFSNYAGDFTVEAWFYPTAVAQSSGSYIWFQGATGTGYSPFIIYQNPSTYNFTMYASSNGSSWNLASGVTIGTAQANAWNHIAIVRDGTNIKCYMNGVLGSTTAVSTTAFMTTTGNVVVGSALGNANTYLNGYVANLRAVKGSVVYSSAFTPPTSLVTAITNTELLLNFQDAAIKDNAGLNNIDTVGNADIKTTVSGKYSTRALAFDGSGDYLTAKVTPLVDFGSGDWTVESWINLSTINKFNNIVNFGRDTVSGMSVDLNSSNQLRILAMIGGSWTIVATGATGLSANTWYHVAFVRNGSSFKIYLDGTEDGSGTNSGSITNPTSDASSAFQVGYWRILAGTDRYFSGYIDDLRITKGLARYTSNFTAPTEALRTQ